MTESLQGLQAVILLDQHERWQKGDRPLVENYLQQIPDLSTDSQRLLDVFLQEIILREAAGEHPQANEYIQRFPELADEIRLQFEVHVGLPALLPPEVTTPTSLPCIEGYRIDKELGRGTYGVVYEAWEEALQRPVAIKLLPRTAYDLDATGDVSFPEAQAIAQLTHPLIVPIHAVGEIAEGVYFSQDLLAHGTLEDFCQSCPQPPREAAECIAGLADAVHYAHLRRLIHCDLKPANILLRPKDAIENTGQSPALSAYSHLISDFGLAVHLDADSRACNGHLRGTLAYMSPEQTGVTGLSIGPATDVYALGAILYELLTGKPPFAGNSKLDTFLQVRHSRPPDPKSLNNSIPGDLNAICLKCLEKDPGHRYTSAAALAEDLRRYLSGYAPLVVPVDVLAGSRAGVDADRW